MLSLAPGISSPGVTIINRGALRCGAQRPGWKGTEAAGRPTVAQFSHKVPNRPPYSMNQRNAVRGVSREGALSWSEETTGRGPTVFPGTEHTFPCIRVALEFREPRLVSIVRWWLIPTRRHLCNNGPHPRIDSAYDQSLRSTSAVAPDCDPISIN